MSINKFCSTLRDVNIAVLQGSTFGLLVFLLYFNSHPNSVNSVLCLFLDDACSRVSASFLGHLECKIDIELSKVNDKVIAIKSTLNAKKSNLLVINPKLNLSIKQNTLVP